MDLQPLLQLSALGIYFHSLFVSITIGFPPVIMILLLKFRKSGDEDYYRAAKLMTTVLAVNFALGAVTGTLVEFGLVQAWSGTILAIASFAFTPLALELIAFANEIATLVLFIVTLGRIKTGYSIVILAVYWIFAMFSGVLITTVNAWLVVPWGVGAVPKALYPFMPEFGPLAVDVQKLVALKIIAVASHLPLQAIIQNPGVSGEIGVILSDPFVIFYSPFAAISVVHTLLAAILVGSSIVAAAYAYRYFRTGEERHLKIVKSASIVVFALFLIQPTIFGHLMGSAVVEYNPTKFALMEGAEKTVQNPLVALVAYGDPAKPITGFDEFRADCDELGSRTLADLGEAVGLTKETLLSLSSKLGVSISENQLDTALKTELKEICYADLEKSLSRMSAVHAAYYVKVAFGAVGFVSALSLFAYFYSLPVVSSAVRRFGGRAVLIFAALTLLGSAIPSVLGWYVREVGRKPWTVYGLLYPEELVTVVDYGRSAEFATLMALAILAVGISGIFAMYLVATRSHKFAELLKKDGKAGGGKL